MDALDQNIDSSNQLDHNSQRFLAETAKWANFLSIVGFVGIGLMVLGAFFAGSVSAMATYNSGFGLGPGFITIIYLAMAALYFFPVFYLYKFAQKMKEALRSGLPISYSGAFEYLKSHYKFLGIFTIIILSIYALIFVISIVMAIS